MFAASSGVDLTDRILADVEHTANQDVGLGRPVVEDVLLDPECAAPLKQVGPFLSPFRMVDEVVHTVVELGAVDIPLTSTSLSGGVAQDGAKIGPGIRGEVNFTA